MADSNYSRNQKRVSSTAKTQSLPKKNAGSVGEWYPPTRSSQKPSKQNASLYSNGAPAANGSRSRAANTSSVSRPVRSSNASSYKAVNGNGNKNRPKQGGYKPHNNKHNGQMRKSVINSKANTPRKKVKKSVIAAGIVAILIVFFVADTLLNWGKIMPGIKVGDLNVGGMTIAEASQQIESRYSANITDTQITLYGINGNSTETDAKALQDQYTQIIKNGNEPDTELYWIITPDELDVGLPAQDLASKAYEKARGLAGLPDRFLSWFGFARVDVVGSYSPVAIEQLAQEIDQYISDPRVDYGVEIDRGEASITEGHTGYMVDRAKLEDTINKQFFTTPEEWKAGVVYAEFFDLRITAEAAQEAADTINNAIGDGVVFEYDSSAWLATKSAIGKWISVDMVEKDGEYSLAISINDATAKAGLLSYIVSNKQIEDVNVSFEVSGSNVSVHPDRTGKMPGVANAVNTLEATLFGDNPSEAALAIDGVAPSVVVQQVDIPETMTLQTALESGIVSKFSTFTTEYATGTKNEMRNYNIHLMSDLLNNSVCKANGGVWSFIDVGGPSDEAHGFKSAGTIFQGEHVDSIGGGICQVATTVYNSIYEAGMRIVLRNNHSLYIASYPAGRDCSVSWPDMDFKWANDTASDVLVKMSYTDTTVTCDLYGVSPQYTVTSEASDWVEIEGYETKYIVNTSRSSGYKKVTSNGSNARSIYVERKVYDKEGTLIIVDQMLSSYDADIEIIEIGPGEFADQMQAEGKVLRIVDSTDS